MRISRRCVSPTSVQAVTSLVDARGDVAAAGSGRAQGVGLSRSLDKKISRDRVGVALTLDGGVDLGGLHGRGYGHLLELRSELAGGELALGAGEHLGWEGRREHGGERPRGKSSGIWTLARWGRAGMRACTRDATSRVIAGARVRGNGVTGMALTFTGALRVTDMVATRRAMPGAGIRRRQRAAGVKATAEKLYLQILCGSESNSTYESELSFCFL